jgi:hypothetical protein
MKTEYEYTTGKLIHTNWGLGIEYNGKYAFIDIPHYKSLSDYELGTDLNFKLYYTILYKQYRDERFTLQILNTNSISLMVQHPEFKKYNLKESDIQPMLVPM